VGKEGYHSLYRWYQRFEAEAFPDPAGLRAALQRWTLGAYPGVLKARAQGGPRLRRPPAAAPAGLGLRRRAGLAATSVVRLSNITPKERHAMRGCAANVLE